MDRLLREGNPPAGQLASPKPQYKKPGVDEYAPVEGQHGAPFATLKDASGNIVSPATEAKLEQVRALLSGVATENKLEQARTLLDAISGKVATETTLGQAVQKLTDLLERLENALTVQGSVGVTGDVDVSDNAERELGKVTLTGHIQEFAVTSWDDLPPDSVPTGSVAMLIGTDDIRQTDGKEWLPI